jgi:hypothetical protein
LITAAATRAETHILGPHYDRHAVSPLHDQYRAHDWHGGEWNSNTRVLRCFVDVGCGARVVVCHAPSRPNLIVVDTTWSPPHPDDQYQRFWRVDYGTVVEDVEPFVKVEVLGHSYEKSVLHVEHGNYRNLWRERRYEAVDTYGGQSTLQGYAQDVTGIPYNYLKVRVTTLDGVASGEVELRYERPPYGVVDVSASSGELSVSSDFFGRTLRWKEDVKEYADFHRVLKGGTVVQGKDALWAWWLDLRGVTWDGRDAAAVKAVEGRKDVKPNLDRLGKEEPILLRFFAFLHNNLSREKTTNNRLLTAFLERVGTDYDKLRAGLRAALDGAVDVEPEEEDSWSKPALGRSICLTLEGASERVAEGKAKAQWQFAKTTRTKAEALGVSAERHPLLMARIESGDVSLNLFHEAGEEDNLVNVEFDLWERALARPGWADVLVEIAKNASGRTTYSKRVTSYIAFLFRIERYLDRNAPRPKLFVHSSRTNKGLLDLDAMAGRTPAGWKAMPKFVQSQSELEMEEATEEGTTKRRSAMTPVADNEAGVVTVPYVAMSISGMRTTWCYSETYFVAEEGAEDPLFTQGGVYEHELAEKLNGRDDYGVCFFTLTGTDQNTGYPTFLIIFERTTAHGTRVHFHRVHPSRKRGPNGSETPPNRLVEECYRYMAGNVRAEEILHQQGDILLVKASGPGKSVDDPAGVPVYGFENHSFIGNVVDGVSSPVRLVRSTAKGRGNLLGWLHAPTGMRMPHPEHEPVEGVAPGWYEIRRCKSWEANPTSVWTLNID